MSQNDLKNISDMVPSDITDSHLAPKDKTFRISLVSIYTSHSILGPSH
jgi:hypothetical protein